MSPAVRVQLPADLDFPVTVGQFFEDHRPKRDTGGSVAETAPITINDESLLGIRGNPPASAAAPKRATVTIYVTSTDAPLSMAAPYNFDTDKTIAVEFSNWRKRLKITAPPNAIPERAIGR